MEKRIFPDLEGRELVEALEAHADEASKGIYYIPLTSDELIERKDKFAELSIEIEKIEVRKKEAMDSFKAELAPYVDERKEILQEIKAEAIEMDGVLFKIIDHEAGMVGLYNQDGDLIEQREIEENEKAQLTIAHSRRTG